MLFYFCFHRKDFKTIDFKTLLDYRDQVILKNYGKKRSWFKSLGNLFRASIGLSMKKIYQSIGGKSMPIDYSMEANLSLEIFKFLGFFFFSSELKTKEIIKNSILTKLVRDIILNYNFETLNEIKIKLNENKIQIIENILAKTTETKKWNMDFIIKLEKSLLESKIALQDSKRQKKLYSEHLHFLLNNIFKNNFYFFTIDQEKKEEILEKCLKNNLEIQLKKIEQKENHFSYIGIKTDFNLSKNLDSKESTYEFSLQILSKNIWPFRIKLNNLNTKLKIEQIKQKKTIEFNNLNINQEASLEYIFMLLECILDLIIKLPLLIKNTDLGDWELSKIFLHLFYSLEKIFQELDTLIKNQSDLISSIGFKNLKFLKIISVSPDSLGNLIKKIKDLSE